MKPANGGRLRTLREALPGPTDHLPGLALFPLGTIRPERLVDRRDIKPFPPAQDSWL